MSNDIFKPGEDPREAVFLFQPTENGFASMPFNGLSARDGRAKVENAFDYIAAGEPVPKACIVQSAAIDYVGRLMPDFYYIRDCEAMVSSRARVALEALVPGAVEYIEINLKMDPRMIPADAYYYINVLPRAQIIDWQRTKLPFQKRWPSGTKQTANVCDPAVVFKSRTLGQPCIWHEESLDPEHTASTSHVLVRGDLWLKLNDAFPGQLLLVRWT